MRRKYLIILLNIFLLSSCAKGTISFSDLDETSKIISDTEVFIDTESDTIKMQLLDTSSSTDFSQDSSSEVIKYLDSSSDSTMQTDNPVTCDDSNFREMCGEYGVCVDGYCCDTPCDQSCDFCNLDGHEGICTKGTKNTVCRLPKNECDISEYCDGESFECPDDIFKEDGVTCGESLKIPDDFCDTDPVSNLWSYTDSGICKSGICNLDAEKTECPAGCNPTDLTCRSTDLFNLYSTLFSQNSYVKFTGASGDSFPLSRNSNGDGRAFTVSLWLKANITSTETQIIWQYGLANEAITFFLNDNYFHILYGSQYNNIEVITTDTSLFTLSTWHHIAVTFSGGKTGTSSSMISTYYNNLKMYLDGEHMEQTGKNINYGFSNQLHQDVFQIGDSSNGMNNIYVDEIGIYNKQLSSDAILSIYNNRVAINLSADGSSDNLLFYWRMGDGSATQEDTSLQYINNAGDGSLISQSGNTGEIVTDSP